MDIFAQIFFVVLRQVFHNLSSTAIGQYTAARYSTMPHLSELQPEKSISAIYKNSFSSCHAPALVSSIKLLLSLWNAPPEMSILFFALFIHWNCQPVFLIHVLCRSKVIHFVQECLGILGSASLKTVNSK